MTSALNYPARHGRNVAPPGVVDRAGIIT
jgi:hypothetical protein